MTEVFGQVVIGSTGAGKTNYCIAIKKLINEIGRKCILINLDPANIVHGNEYDIDIKDIININEICKNLGPNGALLYCMKCILDKSEWLIEKIVEKKINYILLDCPGQQELFIYDNSLKELLKKMQRMNFRLVVVNLIDSIHSTNISNYLGVILECMLSMFHLELTQINVLSKIDLLNKFDETMALEFYRNSFDLRYLTNAVDEKFVSEKHRELTYKLAEIIDDYSMISLIPITIYDKNCLNDILIECDKANGYMFNSLHSINSVEEYSNIALCDTNDNRNSYIMQNYINYKMDKNE